MNILLFFCLVLTFLGTILSAAASKTCFFVPLDGEPSWRDMAYLAAVPAAEVANTNGGALISTQSSSDPGPELKDYLSRYQPDRIYWLGEPEAVPFQFMDKPDFPIHLAAMNAEEAALLISRTFWEKSEVVVTCRDDDYASALVAAPLAALLEAPILYSSSPRLSRGVEAELSRLGASRILTVGTGFQLAKATNLAGAIDVVQWAKEQGFEVDYLAVVNPLDRSQSKVRKLSLLGAQLAAGRRGLVAVLPFEVEWKKPFKSVPAVGELPAQFEKQMSSLLRGALVAGNSRLPYIYSPGAKECPELFIDREGDGNFAGPFFSGDSIELDGRKWTLSLGAGGSYYDADVHLTWPPIELVTAELREYYEVLGAPPTYLCLAGLPDAVPQGIIRGLMSSPDIATDLPYAMVEGGESSQIAVGRVVAEDIHFGSLYASRVLTYPELFDKEWGNRACQAEWENSFAPLFANLGFDASYRLTSEDIPWLEKPAEGKKGKTSKGFLPDSPVTRTSLLTHMNHSWNFELGRTMKWDAEVLIAPTVVESGGCGTTSLDRSAPGQLIVEGATGAQSPELATRHRSVVSRLFRLGAVSFAGGSREMTAEQLPLRQIYWNGILSGQSVGASHRQSQNIGFLILKEMRDAPEAEGYAHCLYARTLLGDPAVTVQLPGAPRSAPARTELNDDRLTLHAPEKWEVVNLFVPPDWKKWADRDIFVLRAGGAYSYSSWGPEERDIEIPLVLAEFRSKAKIKSISLLETPEEPLGWSGLWQSQRNRDGSYTHRLGARMIDFDQESGQINRRLEQMVFSVTFEP